MKYSYFLFLLLLSVFTVSAQTVIKIPYTQVEQFVVDPEVVYTSLETMDQMEIGRETSVSGGSGIYTYSWSLDEEQLGFDSLLYIDEKGKYVLTVNDNEKGCTLTSSYWVDIAMSAPEYDFQEVTIYPNPCETKFYIQSPNVEDINRVDLYQLDGSILKSVKLNQTLSNPIEIDMTNLPKAQYLVVSSFGHQRIVKILVKK